MNDSKRHWLEVRIGITSKEAIDFLEALANDKHLRARMEKNPREVLFEHHIDLLPGTEPKRVKLPSREELLAYVKTLREGHADGGDPPGSQGFAVLAVSHGCPPPPSPPED